MVYRKPYPTSEQVHALFSYDKNSGTLLWKVRPREGFANSNAHSRWNSIFPGSVAGSLTDAGYWRIRIGADLFYRHRLIWIFHKGPIPAGLDIDHKHGKEAGDFIENLELKSQAENTKNAIRKTGTSGFLGVRLKRGRWEARVRVCGYLHHLGSFDTKYLARDAAREFRLKNGFTERHGN